MGARTQKERLAPGRYLVTITDPLRATINETAYKPQMGSRALV